MVGPSHHPGQEFDERIAEETDKASAVITVGNIWFPVQQQTRRLPGFKALVRNLELANYWRKSGKWGDFARPVGADDFQIIR
jgi:hypothetical protein